MLFAGVAILGTHVYTIYDFGVGLFFSLVIFLSLQAGIDSWS
jgi:hypothetical protein